MMKKRNLIYLAILLFMGGCVLLEWYTGSIEAVSLTPANLVQTVAFVLLLSWWQIADAEAVGTSRTRMATIATVLLGPLGMLIYLLQTRLWPSALLAFFAFWAGLAFAVVIADYVGMFMFG